MHQDDPRLQSLDLHSLLEENRAYTYKSLTEILGIPYRSGNQKKSQINNFSHYFKFEKTGTLFTINEIYDHYITIANSGNRSIYTRFIIECIIEMIRKGEKYFSKSGIMLASGMITPDYLRLQNFKEERARLSNDIFDLNSDRLLLKYFFDSSFPVLSGIVVDALSNLENTNQYIHTTNIFYFDSLNRFSTPEETIIIDLAIEKTKTDADINEYIFWRKLINSNSKLLDLFHSNLLYFDENFLYTRPIKKLFQINPTQKLYNAIEVGLFDDYNLSESRNQLNALCVNRLIQFFSTTSNKHSMRGAVEKFNESLVEEGVQASMAEEDRLFDYSDLIEEEIEKLKYLIICLISYNSPIIEYDISKLSYEKLRDIAYNKQELLQPILLSKPES